MSVSVTPAEIEQIRVLHVDDEPDIAELTGTLLQREDERISVETATDAEDGFDCLSNGKFDCIISDYDMPGQNGIDFLEAVREDYPDLPFILYTGKGSEEIASEAISSGVTDYLQKGTGTDQYTVLANRVTNAVKSYQSQCALQERNRELRRYERMINSMLEAACIYDEQGRFKLVNDFLAEWLGTDREALEGESSTLIPLIQEQYDTNPFQELLDGERELLRGVVQSEFPGHGDAILQYQLTPLYVNDCIEGVVGVTRDITDREQRQYEIEQAREEYHELFNGMNDTAWVFDYDGNILTVNDAAVETLGYSRETLRSMTPHDIDAELSDGDISELIQSMPEDEIQVFESVHETKDGREIPVEISSSLVSYRDEPAILSIARDISIRKEREEELRTILDQMDDAVFIHPPDGPFTFVNQTAVERYGFQKADLFDMTPEDLDAPAESAQTTDRIQAIVQDGNLVFETKHQTSTGETIPVEVNATTTTYQGQSVVLSIARDITERKEARRKREQIIDRVTDAIIEVDANWQFTLVNEQAKEFYDMHAEELVGQNFWDVFDAARGTRFEDEYREVMETREPTSFVEYFSQLDGWFDIKAYPMDDGGIAFYFIEVTEQREYQRELEKKNERLKEFSSVISHDLRSPLNVAIGRLALADDECDSTHHDDIQTALDRMESIIEDVLWLAHEGQDIGATASVDLRRAIEDAWTMVTDHRERVEQVIAGGDELRAILADDDRLHQLLENLFRNAVDHGGGDVTVRVGPLDNGFYVEDTGPGIPEEDIPHVFESGFSTRKDGTGLGLTIVKQIVDAHGWEIDVTDGFSGGTRFEITGVEFATESAH